MTNGIIDKLLGSEEPSVRFSDPRCSEALELLESKRLADGGFPAEKKYYQVSEQRQNGRSLVDWGGTSKLRMNEFVTADALYVLKQANRL